MRKEDKQVIIDSILAELQACPNFYLTDVSDLNAEKTSQLRSRAGVINSRVEVEKCRIWGSALPTHLHFLPVTSASPQMTDDVV